MLRDFTLRNLREPRYRGWLQDPAVVRTIGRIEYLLQAQPPEIEAHVKELLGSKNDCFFAVYWGREFIGTQRIGHIDWRLGIGDIGVMIGNRRYWGRGAATDAVATACRYAFEELNLRKLTGGTFASNTAMVRCFESVGFRREGRLRRQLPLGGKYVDHNLYGLFPAELKAP